jgi:hypothetical protein
MSEEKQIEMYPVFDTLDRLYREGHIIIPNRSDTQNASFLLINQNDGTTAMTGSTFRDLCVNILLAGL